MKGTLQSLWKSFLKGKNGPPGRQSYAASAGQCHVFVSVLALQGEVPKDGSTDTTQPELALTHFDSGLRVL